MNIPDGMPTLSAGTHAPHSGQACVMEYVSVLAGEEFTDDPECTQGFITAVAQSANDALGDKDRYLLVPLIARLASSPGPSTMARNVILNDYLGGVHSRTYEAIRRQNTIDYQTGKRPTQWFTPEQQVSLLVAVLDAYDEWMQECDTPVPHPDMSTSELLDLAERVMS